MLTYDAGVAWLQPTAVALPVAGAAALLAGGRRLPRAARDVLAALVAAAVTGMGAEVLVTSTSGRVVAWSGGWQPHHGLELGIVLEADPIGAGLAVLAGAVTSLALVFAWRYLEDVDAHFQALVLLFLAGATGFCLTGDLFDLFVFFELMGAATYGLTSLAVEDPGAVQGGLNFALVNSLAAYLSFAGIGLLYARTGDLGLGGIGAKLATRPPDALVVAAFVLVLLGFLVKGAVVPFHFWLADAQAVAPPSVGVLVSTVMVPLGIYAVLRTTWIVFLGSLPAGDLRRAYLVLGALTAVVGTVMALGQHHVKRLLAFVALAEAGCVLCAGGLLDRQGTTAAALMVPGQVTDLAAAILLAGLLRYRYGTVDERRLHGAGRHTRVVRWLWVVAGLALAGLPPFGVGLGHGTAEAAALRAGDGFLVPLFVLVPAGLGAAVLRVAGRTFFALGPPPDPPADGGRDAAGGDAGASEQAGDVGSELEEGARLPKVPLPMLVPIVVLLLACLLEGLAPGVRAAATHAAAFFTQPSGYRAAALAHRDVPAPAGRPGDWGALGLGLGASGAAVAVAVASLSLFPARRWRLVIGERAGRRLASGLRALHSGHVGDYVAWLMAGAALVAALVGLPLLAR